MKKIWLCLAFPIVILAGITVYHYVMSKIAVTEVMIRTEGYDPRDLLSGHYLRFRIKYKSKEFSGRRWHDFCKEKPFVCLETDADNRVINDYAVAKKNDCRITMKRHCDRAPLNRFYIPEEYAHILDRGLRESNDTWVRLSISRTGEPYVKNFYIDGMEWDKYAWKVKSQGGIYKKTAAISGGTTAKSKKRRGSR